MAQAQSSLQVPPAGRSKPGTVLLATFLAATFLSAALIFVIQPMFTRFVLPRLGGAPSVWSVAMAFFQAVLFAGYLYAHLLARNTSARTSVVVHCIVTATALIWLPLGIASGWGQPPATGEAIWLLGLFAASIGIPYLALSANGPLLQSWFARATHGTGANPYALYAVSNGGSFLALLSYPLAIEPLMTIVGQSRLWSVGYLLLMLLILTCGALVWVSRPALASVHSGDNAGEDAPWQGTREQAPSLVELAKWSALSAVPTALLVAVTAQISTDIAAIPLVWVVPLALYLLTLVVVFGRWSADAQSLIDTAVPWALLALVTVLVMFPEDNLEGWRFAAELALHLGVFVLVGFLCHGRLVRSRPAASHLTAFYLAMSFGGMVGGASASLLAPNIFSWIAEYPILLVAAALCRPPGTSPGWASSFAVRATAACLAAILIVPGLVGQGMIYQTPIVKTAIGAGCLLAAIVAWRSRVLFAAALAVALAAGRLYPPEGSTLVSFRSFFGVHKIHESEDGRFRLLLHGTTVHGAQRIRTIDGAPETGRPEPLTYYRVGSPIHEALTAARTIKGGPLRIAAIGLGTGSMACLIDQKDDMTYFEIDTTVIEIARDPRRFTFLSECRPDVPVVVGDARLTLSQAPKSAFDVVVVDAFASDSIPTHLLTLEAMALYADKLTPSGIIVLHLSSRHMELKSVAHSVAAAAGLVSREKEEDLPEDADEEYKFDSTVVAVGRRDADLAPLTPETQWEKPEKDALSVRPWTDDYANPLGAIWRQLQQ